MLTVIFRQLYDIYSLSKGYLHLYVFTSDLPVLKLLDIMTVNFGVTSKWKQYMYSGYQHDNA